MSAWHLTDKPVSSEFVRSWGYSEHRDYGLSCPRLTQLGHYPRLLDHGSLLDRVEPI
jgi:hypothetical protein